MVQLLGWVLDWRRVEGFKGSLEIAERVGLLGQPLSIRVLPAAPPVRTPPQRLNGTNTPSPPRPLVV